MPMNQNRSHFETEPCPRCGGSGWYSYCEAWGKTCFQCGVTPKEQGLGRRLTKRGKAAHEFYLSLLPTKIARDLQPGDVIRDRVYGRRNVREVTPTTGAIIRDGVAIRDGYLDIRCDKITFCQVPEAQVYSLLPSAEEIRRFIDSALAYQATLTKQGKPQKRKIVRAAAEAA